MRNYFFTIAFDGTNYHGFQVQKNAITVCEVFQNALQKVFSVRGDVKGCSRTDSGVHANMYCLSVKLEINVPCERIVIALNRVLPDDIAVLFVREVPLEFHARYHSKGKEYVYIIHNSDIKDPFAPTHAYRYGYKLDADSLNRASKAFIGTHDFKAFQSQHSDVTDTIRTIYDFNVTRDGDKVYFTVSGNGFLYNMVRIMVGTLIFVSMGRIKPHEIAEIIDAKDRQRAGKTMPAHGLYLNKVFYEDENGESN